MNQYGWSRDRVQALDRVSTVLGPHYFTRSDVQAPDPPKFAPVSDQPVVGILFCQAGGSGQRYMPDNPVGQAAWYHAMHTNGQEGPPGPHFGTGTAYTEMIGDAVFEGRGSAAPGSYRTSNGTVFPTNGDDDGHMVIQNAHAAIDAQGRQVKKTYVSIGLILAPDVVDVPDRMVKLSALAVARQALLHNLDLSRPEVLHPQHVHGTGAAERVDPGPAFEAKKDEIRELAHGIVQMARYAGPEKWEDFVERLELPDAIDRPDARELAVTAVELGRQTLAAQADHARSQQARGAEQGHSAGGNTPAGPPPAGR